jgi:hypothetical protein
MILGYNKFGWEVSGGLSRIRWLNEGVYARVQLSNPGQTPRNVETKYNPNSSYSNDFVYEIPGEKTCTLDFLVYFNPSRTPAHEYSLQTRPISQLLCMLAWEPVAGNCCAANCLRRCFDTWQCYFVNWQWPWCAFWSFVCLLDYSGLKLSLRTGNWAWPASLEECFVSFSCVMVVGITPWLDSPSGESYEERTYR